MKDFITAKERLTFKSKTKRILTDILFFIIFLGAFIIGGFYG